MSKHTCDYSGVTFETKDKWISVKDKFPPKEELFLFYIPSRRVSMCTGNVTELNEMFYVSDFDDIWEDFDHVTHWMPLPEAPK